MERAQPNAERKILMNTLGKDIPGISKELEWSLVTKDGLLGETGLYGMCALKKKE